MNLKTIYQKIFILFLVLIFSGCASKIENGQVKEFYKNDVPKQFSLFSKDKKNLDNWWEQFNSKELNSLIETALKNNFDMQSAMISVKKAYFAVHNANSSKYPDLSLNTSRSRVENNYKDSSKNAVINSNSLGLSTNYEIDLWGRISDLSASSLLSFEATKEDLRAISSTVISQIIETWITIISVDEQKKLLLKQLKINEDMLNLLKARLMQSSVSILDIYKQEQAVALLKTKLIPIEANEKTLLYKLNILLGNSPTNKIDIENKSFPLISTIPAIGIPSDLIANRPDVISAQLKLKASGYNVMAAKKNRLPKLSLSASYSYSNSDSSKIFDDWISNLLANLTMPLFSGGRLKSAQKIAEAEKDASFINYKNTVITAIKEVEDALVEEKKYRKNYDALDVQIQIAKKTLEEAKRRYFNGMIEFTSVLEAELSLINYQQSQIEVNANILISRSLLHKALASKIPNVVIDMEKDK